MTPAVRLFLAGDVMLGRGIDQILPHPNDPILYESYVTSAADYVELAERDAGQIPCPVSFEYVWGDLLGDLETRACDLRVINLETAITTSDRPAPKGINYRMHPKNAPVLSAAGIDACILANNHVMDWGRGGLVETLQVLDNAAIGHAGAGHGRDEAAAPLTLDAPGKPRVLVLAYGARSSGVPSDWAAGSMTPGLNLLPQTVDATVAQTCDSLKPVRRSGDIVIVSLHWGGNWGYGIDPGDRALAHALIDTGNADIVYGHSSHHPKAVEVHNGKMILYGCGDLINDYEGIGGHEKYRGDLALAYVADLGPDGSLQTLALVPYRIRAFRLQQATAEATAWIAGVMDRECKVFGGRVTASSDRELRLTWDSASSAA